MSVRNFLCAFPSPPPRVVAVLHSVSVATSVSLSLSLSRSREIRRARVSTYIYARSYSIRLSEDLPYDGGELDGEADGVGKVGGPMDGWREGPRRREKGGGGEGRDVGDEAGFQESERTASLNP